MSVQASDVKLVLPGTDLTDNEINTFVDQARRRYEDAIDGASITQDRKDDVVTHLAAHLIASGPERQLSSASEGSGSVDFEGDTDSGLGATTHGQQAMALDPTDQLGHDGHFTLSP